MSLYLKNVISPFDDTFIKSNLEVFKANFVNAQYNTYDKLKNVTDLKLKKLGLNEFHTSAFREVLPYSKVTIFWYD